MKREKSKEDYYKEIGYEKYSLVKLNPFLWKDCYFCKQQFKREKGWSFKYQLSKNKKLYICHECALTAETAIDKIEGHLHEFTPPPTCCKSAVQKPEKLKAVILNENFSFHPDIDKDNKNR
jgi:hypothetical protein